MKNQKVIYYFILINIWKKIKLIKDLMKIGKAFDLDKLEKRLLAPKLINQISKIIL